MTDFAKNIADAADMIVNGYTFTRCPEGFRILNLNHPDRAAMLSATGVVVSTSMDNIEIEIVREYFAKNKAFLEDDDA